MGLVPCDCLSFPGVLLRIIVYNLPLNGALEASQACAAFPPTVKGLWGILEASCGGGARGGWGGCCSGGGWAHFMQLLDGSASSSTLRCSSPLACKAGAKESYVILDRHLE